MENKGNSDTAEDDGEETQVDILDEEGEQTSTNIDYIMRRKENEWMDRLRLLKEESESLMTQERKRYEELEAKHQELKRKHADEVAEMEAHHVKTVQEVENQYEQKLAYELTRYDTLSETLENTRQKCAALIESQDTHYRSRLHNERRMNEARSNEQSEILKRLHDDMKYNHIKFEEVLEQEESEYEMQLLKLREDYEKQLEMERQNTALKQGQLSATTTKLESMKKKVQELKAFAQTQDALLVNETAKVEKLEQAIVQYEKQSEVYKETIGNRDKEIHELKSSNRILEKFRSVLEHRIENLEMEKAPMQEHVTSLETNIKEMQNELAQGLRQKQLSDKEIDVKETRLKLITNEVRVLRQKFTQKDYAMSEMVRTIGQISQMTNLKDMEVAVKHAFNGFVAELNKQKQKSAPQSSAPGTPGTPGTPSAKTQKAMSPMDPKLSKILKKDDTVQDPSTSLDVVLGFDSKQAVEESEKQVEYQNKTLKTLRSALGNTQAKAVRVRREAISEGSVLIEECNHLRKENKELRMQLREKDGAGHGSNNRRGKTSVNTESKGSMTPSKNLLGSASCPSIESMSPQGSILCNSPVVTSPLKLKPLRSQSPGNNRRLDQLSSPAALRGHFERHRHQAPLERMDDMKNIISDQEREIMRLKRQIQILLEEDKDDTNLELSSLQSHSETQNVKWANTIPLVSPLGSLRPLTSPTGQSLDSSFVLATSQSPTPDASLA